LNTFKSKNRRVNTVAQQLNKILWSRTAKADKQTSSVYKWCHRLWDA